MKRQAIQELHTKTVEELKKQLIDLKSAVSQVKMNFALKKEVNTAQRKGTRHDIARVLTVLRTKEGRANGKKNV